MYKFFVESDQIEEDITIKGKDVKHIRNVLRLKLGDEILVCNKQTSKSYKCKIYSFISEEVVCGVIEQIEYTTETKTYIHIFQGLPKTDKMEYIIEKCTEIGVKEITPVIMKRSIVKLDDKDKLKKNIRWRKIAEVAAKQSKRDQILKVNDISNFKDIFKNISNYDIVLIAYENEEKTKLKDVLKNKKYNKENLKIAVIIGPEGGIDNEELKMCLNNNVLAVSLGKTILRTETAPLVISSNILYELED